MGRLQHGSSLQRHSPPKRVSVPLGRWPLLHPQFFTPISDQSINVSETTAQAPWAGLGGQTARRGWAEGGEDTHRPISVLRTLHSWCWRAEALNKHSAMGERPPWDHTPSQHIHTALPPLSSCVVPYSFQYQSSLQSKHLAKPPRGKI